MSVHSKFDTFQENQKEFFDALITEDWSTYSDPFWDFTREQEVLKILNAVSNPKRILDVGCGCGYHDILFAAYPSVEYVLGVDYSEKSVLTANKVYPHDKVERKCVDFLNAKELVKFDVAVSFQVIEHLRDYETFLRKMASAVNEDGYVVIATPNYNRFTNRVRKLFGKEPLFCDVMHYKEFTIEELKDLGEKEGLNLEKYFGYSFSLNIKSNIDQYIPKKILFYLGAFFPKVSNVIIAIYKK
ncbi:MAG TPA: hypothetical protein DIC42_05450 [Holosporales bacterium]|nr:hypothetical protein [Holosporales bacterium]